MAPETIDLFKRNGVVSKQGQLGGVLKPPSTQHLTALQAELTPLVKEAERRHVMLRLGVLEDPDADEPVLVYAIDIRGPHDTHRFISRLAAVLAHHDVQPLDADLGMERVLELTTHLVSTSRR